MIKARGITPRAFILSRRWYLGDRFNDEFLRKMSDSLATGRRNTAATLSM